jgi:hypothetical protein
MYTKPLVLGPRDWAQCIDSVLSYGNMEIGPLPASSWALGGDEWSVVRLPPFLGEQVPPQTPDLWLCTQSDGGIVACKPIQTMWNLMLR